MVRCVGDVRHSFTPGGLSSTLESHHEIYVVFNIETIGNEYDDGTISRKERMWLSTGLRWMENVAHPVMGTVLYIYICVCEKNNYGIKTYFRTQPH